MMSYYNNKRTPRRIRGKSCPAGVRFEINNIKNGDNGLEQKTILTPHINLTKEVNAVRQRRSSVPSVTLKAETITDDELSSQHLSNYSLFAGGVHNSFCCKLDRTINSIHSSNDRSHQHKKSNKANVNKPLWDGSTPLTPGSSHVEKDTNELNTQKHLKYHNTVSDEESTTSTTEYRCNESLVTLESICEQSRFLATAAQQESLKSSVDFVSEDQQATKFELNRGSVGLDILKVSDQNDNLVRWLNDILTSDFGEYDKDVKRLEHHIYGTEVLIENLASQVEETRKEFKMSKNRRDSELSHLLMLNEEMQTIWSEKESEVREMLERFSTYRLAVEADSKEKEEMYAEEIYKRETIIKELEFSKNKLEEELSNKEEVLGQLITGVHELETSRLQDIFEINNLVDGLEGKLSESVDEAMSTCQTISVRLQSVINDLKDSDIKKYTTVMNATGRSKHSSSVIQNGTTHNEKDPALTEDSCVSAAWSSMDGGEKQKNKAAVIDDKSSFVQVESDSSEVNKQLASPLGSPSYLKGTVAGDLEVYEAIGDTFEHEVVFAAPHDTLHDETETPEQNLERLIKRLEEDENECERNTSENDDGLPEEYIEKKTVLKLLEEQWTRYQVLCKEKEDETQHWIKKHKEDTKNLQGILEDQERTEVKNNEALAELRIELDKLRRRNKFLESEVEMANEQGKYDVFVLRENFEKDLNDQLRRQSMTFLSAEETSKNQLIQMEAKNEELRRDNDELRRQISDHCSEIKSWVSEILLLSEEEYNEEFHTISDVLIKLQKIIFENKRTIDELQDQLNQGKSTMDFPGSPTGDTLSQSWGGYSWNSLDSQKELCSHCKQKKWRRVLMGSFDLLDAGIEVKQDEIEKMVERIDVDEAKYRKKQSLKESLELAEARNELLERFGEQNWNSLDTLGENSPDDQASGSETGLEVPQAENEDGNSKSSHFEVRRTQNGPSSDQEEMDESEEQVDGMEEVNGLEGGKADIKRNMDGIHEQEEGRVVDEERDEIVDGVNCDEKKTVGRTEEVMGSESNSMSIRTAGQEIVDDPENEDEDDGMIGGEEEDDDDREDLVRVVNLYRSIVSCGPCLPLDEKMNGENHSKNNNEDLIDSSDEVDGDVHDNNNVGLAKSVHWNDLGNLLDVEPDAGAGEGIPWYPHEYISNDIKNNSGRDEFNIETLTPNVVTNGNDLKTEQPEIEDEDASTSKNKSDETQLVHHEASKLPESGRNSDKPLDQFPEKVENGTSPLCSHCSGILSKIAAGYEETIEKLLDLKSQHAKDYESQILRELDASKADIKRYQQQCEDLEKVCEDYQKRIDEYSDNVRNKNIELRKLKLSSNVMKTEVEWLRHALGIVKDYADLEKEV